VKSKHEELFDGLNYETKRAKGASYKIFRYSKEKNEQWQQL
jgi:hypothetical protein